MQDVEIDHDSTVAGKITRALSQRIVKGTLAPGSRLRQDHVAAEFRASHVPVREAFRRLESRGLVVSEPRRGVRVAPFDPHAIREVTEMRAALEALALRYAVPRMTPAAIEAARTALREAEQTDKIAIWEEANRRFHRALVAPSAMPRLLGAIDDLHSASSRYLFATWAARDWQPRSDAEHRAILAAVTARKAGRAARLLSQHILAAGAALVDLIERQPGLADQTE